MPGTYPLRIRDLRTGLSIFFPSNIRKDDCSTDPTRAGLVGKFGGVLAVTRSTSAARDAITLCETTAADPGVLVAL
jgi:hypothetical protein